MQERNDPANCRVAYDYRLLNDKVYLDPEPLDTIPDMLGWLGEGQTGSFFKVDADRYFNQIEVESGQSVDGTAI